MKRLSFILLNILFVAFQQSAWAQNEIQPVDVNSLPTAVQDLIYNHPERPTMLEVKDILKGLEFPEGIPVNSEWANVYGFDTRLDIPVWTDVLLDYAPALIAKLEMTYPQAVWAFIGRDGAAFADVLEAFYYSMGQKNRVIRFAASKASMKNINYNAIRDQLARQGYDLFNFTSLSKPLVFVDPISKGNGRQGRHILGLIYENLRSRFQPEFLIRNINLVGLVVSTHPGGHISISNRESYFTNYVKDTGLSQEYLSFQNVFNYHRFMSIDLAKDNANEAGYTHFIGAWHDSYGAFYQNGERLEAQIGQQFHHEMKLSILWTQARIWKKVSRSKFLKRVKKAAEELGYKFDGEYKETSCEDILDVKKAI